jgi:putative MATE family efflux protein
MLSSILKRRAVNRAPLSHQSSEEPTQAEIRSKVWAIAWPSVLTFSLMTINGILDRAFVGHLGPYPLAAVGVGTQVLFLLVSVTMAIGTGTTALVARYTGANEPDPATYATSQSISLSIVLGLITSVVAWFMLPTILVAMDLSGATRVLCTKFLSIALFGAVPMFVGTTLSAAFRGIGDTKTPLMAMILAIATHLLLNYTLMLGNWGAPKLGVAGGAIAWVASNVVSMIVQFCILPRSDLGTACRLHKFKLNLDWGKRILAVGMPASITALLRTSSLMAFTGVLKRTVDVEFAVGALMIGLTAESIAFMPGFGFGVAAQALAGQSLGAGKPESAKRYAWSATWQAVGVMSVMGVLFYVLAAPFAALFTADRHVQHLTTTYLRVMALSEPFLGLGLVLTQAMQGAGDTTRPTVVTFITFWLVRQPLAWLFAIVLAWQTLGAWIAMALGTVLNGLLTVWLFRRGAWMKTKV